MKHSLVFIICVCSATLSLAATPHPVSHTDAWIRVSDSVEVRLNVFLDDVLRHQSLLTESTTTVPGSDVASAIAAHGTLLLRQLKIFDQDGNPIPGQISSVPKWTRVQEDVDLSVDASLKLTWQLSYKLAADKPLKQLAFLHHFTHPDLDSVGELRLHLQDKASNRRIDAVIPAERLHTIILPKSQDDNLAPSASQSVPNQLTSRLNVGPTDVNIEFEGPLLLMDIAWPDSQPFVRSSPDSQANRKHTLNQIQANATKQEIELWFSDNVDVLINGKQTTASSVVVEFVSEPADTDKEPTGRSEFKPIPVFASNIGIRLSYPRALNIESVQWALKALPGQAFFEAHVHVLAGQDRFTEILETSGDSSGSNQYFKFEWLNQNSADLPQRFREPSSYSLIQQRDSYPGRVGLVIGAMALAAWSWVIVKKHWLRNGPWAKGFAGLAIIGSCVIPIATLPASTYDVDSKELSRAVEHQISGIYEALQLNNEQQTVTALGTILEDDIREQTYIGTLQSIRSASNEALISLQSVDVFDVDFLAPESDGAVFANCHWSVQATVEHWGHAHERKLVFSGSIQLVKHGLQWKIRTFRPVSSKITVLGQVASSESGRKTR